MLPCCAEAWKRVVFYLDQEVLAIREKAIPVRVLYEYGTGKELEKALEKAVSAS